jgi:2-keto-4-pentenoate hydratase/2-oxohepta-3-ene-1,7-dioic acid hydratase in catechol pathway
MRYAMFSMPGDAEPRLGIVRGDAVLDATTLDGGRGPSTVLSLIQQGPDAWRRMQELAATAPQSNSHSTSAVRWHAPVPRPLKNVVCLGMNYAAHVREAAGARGREAKLPAVPVFFTKAPTSITGPYDDVPVDPAVTQQVDWEVELGFVLGRSGRNIAAADALSHVFGYTVINDLSARELQWQHQQFFKGKSLDGFCPMGPVVVTADEFGDPHSKRLTTRVNGVTKQDSTTADMIFKIDAILEWLSKGITVEAGDVIATGTPQGVGLGRTPPEYLQPGDVVETEVEGIGVLRNRIVNSES